MRSIPQWLFGLAGLLVLQFGWVGAGHAEQTSMSDYGRHPSPSIIVSGQPSHENLVKLAEAGVTAVINLRPNAEMTWDEGQAVQDLNMAYYQIPIASTEDMTLENVRQLDALLQQAGSETVFLHCASGNRVGALAALREGWLKGKDVEAAITTGKAWGLTGLEPAVRKLLQQPPANTASE